MKVVTELHPLVVAKQLRGLVAANTSRISRSHLRDKLTSRPFLYRTTVKFMDTDLGSALLVVEGAGLRFTFVHFVD